MFDYHLHTSVSFDSDADARQMLAEAQRLGLREICFTDHYDFNDDKNKKHRPFGTDRYRAQYDGLTSPMVKIRRGVEFGLTPWNTAELAMLSSEYPFDFIIGSVHFAGGYDPYEKEYFARESVEEAFERYLMKTLECVCAHGGGFDVLGHINYACKSPSNPTGKYLHYHDFSDISDEIMRTLAEHGIGMEINTSGLSRLGELLPSADYLRRFRELGGEIVTVGSDAHDVLRVGDGIDRALAVAKDVFGYVCTFEQRRPIFHKL